MAAVKRTDWAHSLPFSRDGPAAQPLVPSKRETATGAGPCCLDQAQRERNLPRGLPRRPENARAEASRNAFGRLREQLRAAMKRRRRIGIHHGPLLEQHHGDGHRRLGGKRRPGTAWTPTRAMRSSVVFRFLRLVMHIVGGHSSLPTDTHIVATGGLCRARSQPKADKERHQGGSPASRQQRCDRSTHLHAHRSNTIRSRRSNGKYERNQAVQYRRFLLQASINTQWILFIIDIGLVIDWAYTFVAAPGVRTTGLRCSARIDCVAAERYNPTPRRPQTIANSINNPYTT